MTATLATHERVEMWKMKKSCNAKYEHQCCTNMEHQFVFLDMCKWYSCIFIPMPWMIFLAHPKKSPKTHPKKYHGVVGNVFPRILKNMKKHHLYIYITVYIVGFRVPTHTKKTCIYAGLGGSLSFKNGQDKQSFARRKSGW